MEFKTKRIFVSFLSSFMVVLPLYLNKPFETNFKPFSIKFASIEDQIIIEVTMKVLKTILLLGLVVAISPIAKANIGVFDEVWQNRAEKAKKAAQIAYEPNPENVTNNLNSQTHKVLEGYNNTRRGLGKYRGPCLATNPIDRCWRCDPNWARNRKKLAECVLGFGRKTTGGKAGRFYVVTDPSDNDMVNPKPGTLRHAVIQKGPLWITFAHDMVIRLNQELIMTSNKTIDGRGADVHFFNGAQITLQFIQNVIIHGIHIRGSVPANGGMIRDSVDHYGFRTRSDGDGISIFGSHNIWIDHVSMSKCSDGLIDVIQASTAITISNCHFTYHNDVLLFGGSDSYSDDKVMQVTVAFNHFGKGLVQRMPRVRWGFVHVVNNDYTHWLMYAIGGSKNPTILSQGNRFIAPDINACKEVTKRDYAPKSEWKSWNWRSDNDLMMNGAFFVQSGGPIASINSYNVVKAKPGTYASRLTRLSGALNCIEGKPC
ncbi:pectate lyase-like [Durio zibethinus]|uniref:Pectate lyase n=1 Tax=Durio zibethinus TaxID=66656 RepID=A0A6P5YA06_DURZI|nr:pectate lyase-like [Durio zibethinus]